jgi:hypothetical protein
MKKLELKQIIKEEISKILNEEQDFVVTGYSGGYTSSRSSYTYIVSAKNKIEAKNILKRKKNLQKISAHPVSDFKTIDPYREFEVLK